MKKFVLCVLGLFCLLLMQTMVLGQTFIAGTAGAVTWDSFSLAYPPIARAARIQGPVRLVVTPDSNGKPQIVLAEGDTSLLLLRTASENVVRWTFSSTFQGKQIQVRYQFTLVDAEVADLKVPRGNIVKRIFLKVGGRKTFTKESVCVESANKSKVEPIKVVSQDPLVLEVTVVGRVACMHFLQALME